MCKAEVCTLESPKVPAGQLKALLIEYIIFITHVLHNNRTILNDLPLMRYLALLRLNQVIGLHINVIRGTACP
jgi:hypothetical protein